MLKDLCIEPAATAVLRRVWLGSFAVSQDLTYGDISRYVRSSLSENLHFQRLAEEEPVGAPKLVAEVVSPADGVFL